MIRGDSSTETGCAHVRGSRISNANGSNGAGAGSADADHPEKEYRRRRHRYSPRELGIGAGGVFLAYTVVLVLKGSPN